MPGQESLLCAHGAQAHTVQLFGADERLLIENVGRYLADGLQQGEAALVIATPAHWRAFTRELERLQADPEENIRRSRLVFRDAAETLASFMPGGEPDWERFEAVISAALAAALPRDAGSGRRAYGEMVGLLWEAGQYDSAALLEDFWNRTLPSSGCRLFCGYPIDVFGSHFHSGLVEPILAAHTHVVGAGRNGAVENAVERAIEHAFGPEASAVKVRVKNSPPNGHRLPPGESAILNLRRTFPESSEEILTAAHSFFHEEKRFRALIENSSDAIFLVNRDCKILYASTSTRRVLGYDPEELIGGDRFELIHPEDRATARGIFERVLQEPGVPVQLQARVRHKDGSWRWVESAMTNLLEEPDVGAIVSNYRDITDRRAAEQARQKAAEELARNFAELQAFSYVAAHDLKEPVRTISVYTDLLLQQAQMDENCRYFANLVVESARHMSSLLDDLLALASVSFTEALQRVELRKAVDQALNNLRQSIEESGASVTVEDLPVVAGYENQLVQVFQNLLSNAIKYRGEQPAAIRVSAARVGLDWLVKVADNGIGIDPKYHDYVFGVFKRLHSREIPGTGIGLAICKKIVEGLGGRIWVESQPGKGSTFCFTVAGFREQVQPDTLIAAVSRR